MTTHPDAAAAVLFTDRARHALNLSRGYLAQAEALFEQPDPDDLHGDVRRAVYTALMHCADAYERYADDCRERAHSAQELRRHRYDVEHYTDMARQAQGDCPTCSGPIRETVGMVCQTCGTDYAAGGAA